MNKFSQWYESLPASVKVLIKTVESSVTGVLIVWLSSPHCDISKASLQQLMAGVIGAVVLAFRNWLVQSPLQPILADNRPDKAAQ